jgi:hypothetical protein
VELTTAILRIFRDEGERKDRQKARLMWLVERYGEVTEVDGHARCHPSYRDAVVAEMASYGSGSEKLVDVQQPRPTSPYERRNYMGEWLGEWLGGWVVGWVSGWVVGWVGGWLGGGRRGRAPRPPPPPPPPRGGGAAGTPLLLSFCYHSE